MLIILYLKQPTFGGFGSSSGFGGFKSSSTTTNDTTKKESTSSTNISTSVPSFGSFAKATTSPFATAVTGNALGLPHSPATSSNSTDLDNNNNNNKDSDLNESDNESNTDTPTAFGESAKVKVPGIKQQTEGKI